MRKIAPALVLLLLSACFCGEREDESRVVRNAVVILIDTCRYDEVGRRTRTGPVTPHLDRFAAGATRFTKATSPAPWTLPAVASLLTSVYPTVHGASGRYPEFSRVRAGVPTAAELMRDAGFETGAIVNVAFLDPALGTDRGFDTYDYVGGANRKIRRADEVFRRAIDWLDERGEERFFLLVHLFDPHMDFDPVEPFLSRFLDGQDGPMEPPFTEVARWREAKDVPPETIDFARALYRAEIAAVDEGVGLFLDYLDRSGLSDETVVAVTADHGEEFWEHGKFEHGHTLYEEIIHVPLMIRVPRFAGEEEVGARVSLVDVVPSLFDLLGLPVSPGFQGESLVPLMKGAVPGGPRYRFSEALLYGHEWKAVVGDRYKFSWNEERQIGALFDLHADPWEMENLLVREPERTEEMAAVLIEWIREGLRRTGGSHRGEEIVDMEETVVEQLRSLGYID